MGEVPALVLPCVEGRELSAELPAQASHWASILPATWSFMLAASAHGLGTTLTTAHLRRARDVAAIVGLPDGVLQACLVPVAHTLGGGFRPARRNPVASVLHWNRW
jgi:nitroreductase